MRCGLLKISAIDGRLLVCGKLGLIVLDQSKIFNKQSFDVAPLYSLDASASQKCFNAMKYDSISKRVFLGCEDGSVVVADVTKASSDTVVERDVDDDYAVLDLDVSSSFIFVGCSNALVQCYDKESYALLWRLNLQKGQVEKAEERVVKGSTLRCTNVLVDPAQKWLICGCGGNLANNEGGFFSLWHIEAREVVSVMPMRGCPSGCGWVHDELVCCGAESTLYQYSLKGLLTSHSTFSNMRLIKDIAVFYHPDDLIGAGIVVCGESEDENAVSVVSKVGRNPISLSCNNKQ